eukprot:TRINITY_DN3651_c0_g1_i1.p1 TRINITY_DN3651_c0_g1~~TRINITY_DN3651_c0_g1_i1.p1  ORF type:complete len:505 (+),score=120.73 TRINITY_DN3651_c0_g1_i1:81-1595(+)
MEVVMEAISEIEALPGDTFVSLRVGESQKQSRLVQNRVFKFPANAKDAKGPFGRVEVFRRVGTGTVPLDAGPGVFTEVEVPCCDDYEPLHLRLAVKDTDNFYAKHGENHRANMRRAHERVEAAREYLERYHVEEVVALAMRELIQTRPNEPHKFLSQYILESAGDLETKKFAPFKKFSPPASYASRASRGKAGPGGPPPRPSHPHTMASSEWEFTAKSVPVREFAKTVPENDILKEVQPDPASEARPVSVVPFQESYSENIKLMASYAFRDLHDKFPSKWEPQKSAFQKYYVANIRSMAQVDFTEMHMKFDVFRVKAEEAERKWEELVKGPIVPFAKKPSVGTWLAPAASALVEELPEAGFDGPPEKLPSVGTWLAPRLIDEEAEAWAKDPSLIPSQPNEGVGKWVWQLRADGQGLDWHWQSAEEERIPLKHLPSAGTWCMGKPHEVEKPWYYKAPRPSGTNETTIRRLQGEIASRDREIAEMRVMLDKMAKSISPEALKKLMK